MNENLRMNILILSAGTRNIIISYFRHALCGRGVVIAADADPLSPALYEADRSYVVPLIGDPGYVDCILGICRKERIAGVLSLIDPEQTLLAACEGRFRELGVTVIGSPAFSCELAFDKFRMYRWLWEHGYYSPRSWMDHRAFFEAVNAGDVDYPVFLKPVRGSASVNAMKAADALTVEWMAVHQRDVLIQEYLPGPEIGADVYVDLISGEVVSVFTKKKLRMRAGETDRSVSIKDEKLFSLIERFVADAGFRGPVDIDLIQTAEGYAVLDVNPRFGGGYPHAHACGCDHVRMIIDNLQGRINQKRVGEYQADVYMVKYSEAAVLKQSQNTMNFEKVPS